MPNFNHKPIPSVSEKWVKKFWSKVDVRSADECWPWKAGTSHRYGRTGIGHRISYPAHRIALFISTGIQPGDLVVMHSCDNPPCCNPAHLSLGTHAENIKDSAKKGRMASGSRHYTKLRPELIRRPKITLEKIDAITKAYDKFNNARQELRDLLDAYRIKIGYAREIYKWGRPRPRGKPSS